MPVWLGRCLLSSAVTTGRSPAPMASFMSMIRRCCCRAIKKQNRSPVGDDRNAGSTLAPAVRFAYSPDRKGTHPKTYLANFSVVLQADAYAGFNELYRPGDITEVACWAHARQKIHDIHVRTPSAFTESALFIRLDSLEMQLLFVTERANSSGFKTLHGITIKLREILSQIRWNNWL